MNYPTKNLFLGHRRFAVSGLADTDSYFQGLCDNYEPDFAFIAAGLVDNHHVCIDIGANIGVKALTVAQYAKAGRVIAIEASPSVGAVLEHNVALNGLGNMTVVKAAVGGTDGTAHFHEHSAWGYVSSGGVAVPMKRLETIYDECHLNRLDFVKMDVEGYEQEILRDCHEFINAKGAAVLLEFNAYCLMALGRVDPRAFIEWLLEHFKHVVRINRHASGVDLFHHLGPADAAHFLHCNLVDDRGLTDVLVTNNPRRLDPTPRLLAERLESAARELAVATEDRNRLARDQAALTAERDSMVRERDALAKAHTEVVTERDRLVKEIAEVSGQRNGTRAELDAVRAQLDAIRSTRYWKLASKLGAIR